MSHDIQRSPRLQSSSCWKMSLSLNILASCMEFEDKKDLVTWNPLRWSIYIHNADGLILEHGCRKSRQNAITTPIAQANEKLAQSPGDTEELTDCIKGTSVKKPSGPDRSQIQMAKKLVFGRSPKLYNSSMRLCESPAFQIVQTSTFWICQYHQQKADNGRQDQAQTNILDIGK